jgi:hypothetical protein
VAETGDDFSPVGDRVFCARAVFFIFFSSRRGERECHSGPRRWRRRPFLGLLRTKTATFVVLVVRIIIFVPLAALLLLTPTLALFPSRNPLPFPPPPPLLIRIPQLVLVPLERHHVRIDPERRAVDLVVRGFGGVEEAVAFARPVREREGGGGGGLRCSPLCRRRCRKKGSRRAGRGPRRADLPRSSSSSDRMRQHPPSQTPRRFKLVILQKADRDRRQRFRGRRFETERRRVERMRGRFVGEGKRCRCQSRSRSRRERFLPP